MAEKRQIEKKGYTPTGGPISKLPPVRDPGPGAGSMPDKEPARPATQPPPQENGRTEH